MNLAAWVEKWGRAAPDRPAIACGGATHSTYRQWAARARAFAAKVRDVSELLAALGPVAPRQPLPARVGWPSSAPRDRPAKGRPDAGSG